MRCIEVLKFDGGERVERVAYTPSGRFGNQEPLDPALPTRASNEGAGDAPADPNEPSLLEMLLYERKFVTRFGEIGPLTKDQADAEQSYEAYMVEMEAEHEAQMAAGGRQICPKCGERKLTDRTVKTLGVRGRSHPGDEYSALYECEGCDYRDLG